MMDEIAAVKKLKGVDTPASSQLAVARARHQLVERIDEETGGRHRTRSTRRRAFAAVAAVAATSIITVGLVSGGSEPPRAEAAAVRALDSAAEHVRQLDLPTTRPGQYLLQERIQVTWGSAADADRNIRVGGDGKPVVWATKRVFQVWIPHDPSDLWVVRERAEPFALGSKDAQAFVDPPEDEVWKARNGVFGSHWTYSHPSQYAELYRDYPRDPAELLDYVREHPVGDGTTDAAAFDDIGSILRNGTAPVDLRSALYQALTRIPGVTLASDEANLAGQNGVAVAYPGQGQLIFDPSTGAFIGERDVSPGFPDVAGLGPDKVTLSTVVSTRVVDHAPLAAAQTPGDPQ